MENKYYIMDKKISKDNYESLYQFETTVNDNTLSLVEYNGLEELDVAVEKMLNEEGISKNDFIIVKVIDYNVKADIVENVSV